MRTWSKPNIPNNLDATSADEYEYVIVKSLNPKMAHLRPAEQAALDGIEPVFVANIGTITEDPIREATKLCHELIEKYPYYNFSVYRLIKTFSLGVTENSPPPKPVYRERGMADSFMATPKEGRPKTHSVVSGQCVPELPQNIVGPTESPDPRVTDRLVPRGQPA